MSLIRWNGSSDYLKWATLAAAIQNAPGGAWTELHGVRHNSLTGYQGYGYLLSGTGAGVTQLGIGKRNQNDLFHDFSTGAVSYGTLDPVVNEDTLYVCAKAAGTVIPNASKKVGSGGTWAHQAADTTIANKAAAAQLQLGTWQLSDLLNGWQAVYALWNVELSQAQRIACGANWQTSDIYNAHPTPPLILLELNVAAGSIVNLGTASIGGTAHNGTTLDAAQTFGGWNFNGIGAAGTEYVDAGTAILILTPSATETRERTDSDTVRVAFTPSGVETKQTEYVDSAVASLKFTPSATEQITHQFTDSDTVRLTLTPASTDILEVVDAGTILLVLTPSGTEQQLREFLDSATIPLSLTPLTSDIFASVDQNTVLVNLQPSGTETQTFTYVDANTVPLTFAPSSVDTLQTADVDTVSLLLTPSGIDDLLSTGQDSATIPLLFTISATEEILHGYTDADTISLLLTPSSTSTMGAIDAATAISTLTPSAVEAYFSGANEDSDTVVLHLIPITTQEVWFLFDTLLTATLTRSYSGALQSRLWSATVDPRRWAGTLGERNWSATIARRWAGMLGRS